MRLHAAPLLGLALLVVAGEVSTAEESKLEAKRADLALTYMDFERARAGVAPIDTQRRASINRSFDQATLAFFSGATGRALVGLRKQTLQLKVPRHPASAAPYLLARIAPPVWQPDSSEAPRLRIELLRGAPTLPEALRLFLVPESGGAAPVELPLEFKGQRLELPLKDLSPLKPGSYLVQVRTAAGASLTLGRWTVTPRAPGLLRTQLLGELQQLQPAKPSVAEAARACEARLGLLQDAPNEADTAQFLADPNQLMRELKAEVAALKEGQDPYRRKLGTYWRPYASGGRAIPLRVYAPAAATDDAPLPLVVAFHGAGGDENMFAWGYGRGALLRLAEERGFLVAMPRTDALVRADGQALADLLTTLADDYRIDRRRVYLLGHSLGVMALDRVLKGNAERVSAVASFSGVPRGLSSVPVLALLGAQDPLQGFSGKPKPRAGVEVRRLEGYGHTLLVGDRLPAVIEWLFATPTKNKRWF